MRKTIETLGKYVIETTEDFLGLTRMSMDVILGRGRASAYTEPISTLIVRHVIGGLPVVIMGMFMLGAVSQWLVGIQVMRLGFSQSVVGPDVVRVLFHALVPVFTAFFSALAMGASAAARLAMLNRHGVGMEMEMAGFAPSLTFVRPLLWAFLLSMPLVMAMSMVAAFGGAAMSAYMFGSNPLIYLDFSQIKHQDAIIVTLKTASFAMLIPLISGFHGLKASNPGKAASRAVMDAMLMCGGVDLVLGYMRNVWVS